MLRKVSLAILVFSLFGTICSANNEVEQIAKSRLGDNYVWGGVSENNFDCSGYTKYIYKKLGVDLPRTAYEQSKIGKNVEFSNLKKGDLLFFKTDNSRNVPITHVGVYLEGDKFIHAAGVKDGVVEDSLIGKYGKALIKAKRVIDISDDKLNSVYNDDLFYLEKRARQSSAKIDWSNSQTYILDNNSYQLKGGF